MNRSQRSRLETALSTAALVLVVATLFASPALAQRPQYVDDGAIQNPLGGWDLPAQGSCPADTSKTTRPDCLALRLNVAQASCTSANNYSWSTGVCNDLVNNTQALCDAAPGRLWNSGTGVCAITLKNYDRNNVQCTLLGGSWVTTGTCTGVWVMPPTTAYTPNLLTSNGAGDQCLRCHNDVTQYNGPRVRDVGGFIEHGHKNIVKPVKPGVPQYGPGESTPYPTDESGNAINWSNGTVTVGGVARELAWLVNNWMAPLVRSYYEPAPSTSKVCTVPTYTTQTTCEAAGALWVLNAGLSYSCARCHTTGYTSDATLQTAKLPESQFPGITWTREADATTGVIGLATGISGDTNKFASWDAWGVTCSKCHGSAIDLDRKLCTYVPVAIPPQTQQSVCTANGHSWSATTSTCSGTTTESQCTTLAGTWTLPYGAPIGQSTHHNNLTAVAGAMCSDPRFTAQAQCQAAGATWIAAAAGTASCSVAGVCKNRDPLLNTQALCEASQGVGAWFAASDIVRCLDIHEYGKANNVAAYAAAKWTGTQPQRGQIITALCLNCHRADTSGVPNEPTTILAGNSHGVLGFVGHAVGQEYLNSPHAKYTGNFAGIATGTYKADGSGEYKSDFMTHGEAANTGNGCSGCHDVHKSIEAAANPAGGWLREECSECHESKVVEPYRHPAGPGTPFEHGAEESCMSCHMPGGLHLWRINTDATYATFPAGAVTANTAANARPDGNFASAVWVDVDLACGQCHGGGTAQVTTNILSNVKEVLTVADATGFYQAARVRIPGAGALQADGVARADFYGTVKSVDLANNKITLLGAATLANVGGRTLTENPTINNAGYKTKAQLAADAADMHEDKPTARFVVSSHALTVTVDAARSECEGGCVSYDWNWGDGTVGSGLTATHTYATAPSYPISRTITLTVASAEASASVSKTVSLNGPGPTAGASCSFDPNTWQVTVSGAPTAPNGIKRVSVFWGDSTPISSVTAPPYAFSHTYAAARPLPAFYKVQQKVTDLIGHQTTVTVCQLSPAYFAIGGTVTNGTAAIANAKVQVKQGTTAVRTGRTAAGTGAFSLTSLPPGTYDLYVTDAPGYADQVVTGIQIGPSSLANGVVLVPAP